eukprot:317917-Pyramimonas_sp.AAC.1
MLRGFRNPRRLRRDFPPPSSGLLSLLEGGVVCVTVGMWSSVVPVKADTASQEDPAARCKSGSPDWGKAPATQSTQLSAARVVHLKGGRRPPGGEERLHRTAATIVEVWKR